MRDYNEEFLVLEDEFNKKLKTKYGKCWEYDSKKDTDLEVDFNSTSYSEKDFLSQADVENYNDFWGDFWDKMHVGTELTEEKQDYFDDFLNVKIDIFNNKDLDLSKEEIENILNDMLSNAKDYIDRI